MADYILSCCSTADLSKEHFERRQIHYICFHYTLDGVEYPDDLGQSVSFDRFYQAMADGAQTSTSQVNVQEYLEYFTDFLPPTGLAPLGPCRCPAGQLGYP